jgi:hypothetical protein
MFYHLCKKSPVELVKNVVFTENYMAKPLKVREQSEIKILEFVNPCVNVVIKNVRCRLHRKVYVESGKVAL